MSLVAASIGVLSAQVALADDAPMIQFKDEPAPEAAKPTVKKSDSEPEYVDLDSPTPYSTAIGYPKITLGASYNPGFFGFKQTLQDTGEVFNISGPQALAFGALLHVEASPLYQFELEASYLNMSVGDLNFSPYLVKASSTNTESIYARMNRCFYFSSFGNRLCPGIEIGLDTYPSLDFGSSNTVLTLTSISDMVVGLVLNYELPLTPSLTMNVKARYDEGLKIGQSATLGVTDDSKIVGQAGLTFPIGERSSMGVLADIESRTASVHSTLDDWKSETVSYSLMVGYSHALGSN
jgi:hypothetical protein